MRAWLILAAAIVTEVTATMALRASVDHAGWAPVVLVGYVTSFVLMGATLRAGLPIGVVYGVWGACGVALTAMLGALIFHEYLSPTTIVGIGLIVVGVVLVESGSRPAAEAGG